MRGTLCDVLIGWMDVPAHAGTVQNVVQERALSNCSRTLFCEMKAVFFVVVVVGSNSVLRDDLKSDCGLAGKNERVANRCLKIGATNR